MIELSKQVGELSSLIMVNEKYYFPNRNNDNQKYLSSKDKIADELADIFYAVIRIARHYSINFEDAHIMARNEEDKFLKDRGI